MKAKPVIPRTLALLDVDETISHYLRENAEHAALGFIDALEQAYTYISRHPAMGSTRYAHEMDLPGLRCWSLSRYPYAVFYVERPDHIDVWRVLHGMRDLPAWLHPDTTSDLADEIVTGTGLASGPVKSAEEVFERIEDKYANKRTPPKS